MIVQSGRKFHLPNVDPMSSCGVVQAVIELIYRAEKALDVVEVRI